MDKQLLGYILLKQIQMMAILYGKITDMITSIALRMLTGSAKQDHVEYELLGISCSKIIFKKLKQFSLYYMCYV